jgi:hypothetical protein
MEEVFSQKWFIATVATWVTIIILDEFAYYWWKKINPGSQWTGLIVKHPLQTQTGTGMSDYPNGYRPAGGQ